ncbi:uncharacterized protein LOC101217175 [Cucumis sativus]|uniref:Senescence regulator n=1 Tax=Cucumis sativus TaxID=3659 RepID=A0A0A0KNP6_CUCSA|nr:uncharacterized protein LOC101217175 [Cucumis sativus]
MAEEFHESDIIFADHHHHYRRRRRRFFHPSLDFAQILLTTTHRNTRNNTNDDSDSDSDRNHHHHHNNSKDFAASLPVKIPETVFRYSSDMEELDEEWNSEDNNNIVPPHVIIGQRLSGKMAFSVRSGNGRTLKGRDLSEVRNSILRMTGFLET